eukprot:15045876-Alexandrium_andersonii.AAC.1
MEAPAPAASYLSYMRYIESSWHGSVVSRPPSRALHDAPRVLTACCYMWVGSGAVNRRQHHAEPCGIIALSSRGAVAFASGVRLGASWLLLVGLAAQ